MVQAFREVHRVLRDDGTLWLNIGDSYCSTDKWGGGKGGNTGKHVVAEDGSVPSWTVRAKRQSLPVIKPKDMMGIPWTLALALRADGWYLRSEVIWEKPNCMPDPAADRPTKSHEQLFLLTKSPDYFFDMFSVREPVKASTLERDKYTRITTGKDGQYAVSHDHETPSDPAGRHIRSVWTISTKAFHGSHFATFPPKLVEPCIKAGTSEKGCCPECSNPWVRETEVDYVKSPAHGDGSVVGRHYETGSNGYDGSSMPRLNKEVRTTGWRPTCDHGHKPIPCVVLDNFSGVSTTGVTAMALNRRYVGVELSVEHLATAKRRIEHPHAPIKRPAKLERLPLFPEDAA